jgi:hypothetical protein
VIRALIWIKLVSDCETKVTALLPAILEIRLGGFTLRQLRVVTR